MVGARRIADDARRVSSSAKPKNPHACHAIQRSDGATAAKSPVFFERICSASMAGVAGMIVEMSCTHSGICAR